MTGFSDLSLFNQVALITGYATFCALAIGFAAGFFMLLSILLKERGRRITKFILWLYPPNQRRTLRLIGARDLSFNNPEAASRYLRTWWIHLYPVFKAHCQERTNPPTPNSITSTELPRA